MKILFVFLILIHGKDIIFKAMEDELKRSLLKLKLENEKPPYYLAYRIVDEEKVRISASFGAIIEEKEDKSRYLFIDLRVGDYEFDNSNFVSISGAGPKFKTLPLEDDYDAIRHYLWLSTDEAYKEALDLIAKKKSTIIHKEIKEKIPDFSKSPPYEKFDEIKKLDFDKNFWKEKIKEISNLFRKYPKIQVSKVIFEAKTENQYFINSENSKHLRSKILSFIEVIMKTQTDDGIPLYDYRIYSAETPKELDIEKIKRKIIGAAETLSIIASSKEIEEYEGPVLIKDDASPEFFYHLLVRGICNARKPIYEREISFMIEEKEGFLVNKIGKRILPDNFSIYDDPYLKNIDGVSLMGGLTVDDEGVKPERIEIVKEGRLINIPMSKTPVKEFKNSNGHGRYFNGKIRNYITNLIIESSEKVPEIEKEFIEIIKKEGLEYGIVIKKFSTKKSKTLEELYQQILSGKGEKEALLPPPFLVYKIYPDGKKEIVRGINFEGITPSILKDIICSGNDKNVCNFLLKEESPIASFRIGSYLISSFPSQYLPVSIVSPSVIIEKITISKKEEKAKKKPYLEHPYFERKKFER